MINKDFKILQKHLDVDKLPKGIKISTITITCRIDAMFNNLNIEKYLDLDEDVVTIKSMRVNRSSLVSKKRRKTKTQKTKKAAFYNQVSIAVQTKELDASGKNYRKINVKLFINGAIQITGCKSIDDFKGVLTTVFNKLKNVKAVYDKDEGKIIEKLFVSDPSYLDLVNVKQIKIAMINSSFDIGYSVDRENLYGILANDKITCSFDPVMHAGVKIKYFYDGDKKISIFVFEKGTIIITGAKSCKHIAKAHKFIDGYLKKNYNSVSKTALDSAEGGIDDIIKQCGIAL